jgi:cytochrome c
VATQMACPDRFPPFIVAVGMIALCATSVAFAQSPAERRGLEFVRLHCARCHAVEKAGKSPLANAPAFGTLHLKYSVSDLQRPLAQGVHPLMPRFQLDAGQVEDIMAYLKTLEP